MITAPRMRAPMRGGCRMLVDCIVVQADPPCPGRESSPRVLTTNTTCAPHHDTSVTPRLTILQACRSPSMHTRSPPTRALTRTDSLEPDITGKRPGPRTRLPRSRVQTGLAAGAMGPSASGRMPLVHVHFEIGLLSGRRLGRVMAARSDLEWCYAGALRAMRVPLHRH